MNRLITVIASLLIASSLSAQTVGDEVATGDLGPRTISITRIAPAVAMARDKIGVAIAWTMRSGTSESLFVTRLDATAHFSGAPIEIRPAFADMYITSPSIAASPDGNGFVVAWLETAVLSPTTSRVVYARLDASLHPSAAQVLTDTGSSASPVVVRSGEHTVWIAAGRDVWQLRDDGTAAAPLNAGVGTADMTIVGDLPRVAAADVLRPATFTYCSCGVSRPGWNVCPAQCQVWVYKYSLQFVALYAKSAATTFTFNSMAQPAIGSDGHDTLVVWMNGEQTFGGSVLAMRLSTPFDFPAAVQAPTLIGTFGADAGGVRPDVATDGERYLVVWRSGKSDATHDIVGAAIDRAGRVTPLSIATSSADERDPAVIAISEGRFLVTYESVLNGERRLAGRIVTFPTRPRAVR